MRSLDVFILDEMIEQFSRHNPLPDKDGPFKEAMHAELLVTLLEELKALRSRSSLYEMRIGHLNKELKDLLIINASLKINLERKHVDYIKALVGKVVVYKEEKEGAGRIVKVTEDDDRALIVNPEVLSFEDTKNNEKFKHGIWAEINKLEIKEVL